MTWTIDQFTSYFSKYGKVTHCQIMKDRDTGKSRGFGFVTFETEEAVDRVLANIKEHKLLDKWVECKKATPSKPVSSKSQSQQPHMPRMPNVRQLFLIKINSPADTLRLSTAAMEATTTITTRQPPPTVHAPAPPQACLATPAIPSSPVPGRVHFSYRLPARRIRCAPASILRRKRPVRAVPTAKHGTGNG
ncbi:MAG: hypothetical protein P4L10_09220 [Acidobacteriaceae bacterium]|nr:hypothetical protein [Acidobacteriaceae bacterium]